MRLYPPNQFAYGGREQRLAIDIEQVRQAFRKAGQVYHVLAARGDEEVELTLATGKRP